MSDVTAICAACTEEIPATTGPCPRCGASPLLDGRYRLDAILGRGAVGTTYRATRLDGVEPTDVAIKEILVRRLDSFKTEDLFRREARTLEGLAHPGVPRHHEDFVAGAGRDTGFYLVTDRVDGQTLAAEAARRRYAEDDVLAVLDELLDVLVYLHDRRPPVIHRDIKPANVMRARDGRLVLIDFGAVREATAATLGGTTVAGTFGYMPPEQLAGRATPASDLYALGVLAVVLLARQDPADLLDARNVLQWEPAVSVRPAFRALLRRMLVQDPDQRLASASDARDAVRAIREGRAIALPRARGELVDAPPAPRDLPVAFTARVAPAASFLMLFGGLFAGIGGAVPLGLTLLFLAIDVSFPLMITLPLLALFVGIGGLTFGIGWRKRNRLRTIYRDGQQTVGEVTHMRQYVRLRVNGRYPYEVGYSYVVDGRSYTGRSLRWTPLRDKQEGDAVTVLYDPSAPSRSLLYPLGGKR